MFVIRRLLLSLQTLTRIPLPVNLKLRPRDVPGAVGFYPVAGFLVGSLSWLAAGAVSLFAGPYLTDIIMPSAIVAVCLLTGGLHIDGFADCCDALGSGKRGEAALDVMKDSRLGTMGVLGILFDVGVRFLLLQALYAFGHFPLFPALALAPCVAKTSIAVCCLGNRYARPDGTNKSIVDECAWRDVCVNAAFALCAVGFVSLFWRFVWWRLPLISVAAVLTGFAFSKFMSKRLDGINGDVLGASNEIAELTFMIGLLWRR